MFGTAGTPHSSKLPDSVSGIQRVAELGLSCMELEFVRGVKMGRETAQKTREAAEAGGVTLSVHGPYFINLNAREKEKYDASLKRIVDSAVVGELCGATSVTFHPAFYLGDDPATVFPRVKTAIEAVLAALKSKKVTMKIAPETMGRATQFGSFEETLRLCEEIPGLSMCLDFPHLHARTGKFNTRAEFSGSFKQIARMLGEESLRGLRFHVSGIDYGGKGERKHLVLGESDFAYKDLLKAMRDFDVGGLVICESPNIEDDALLLQNTYANL
jgi:deoxyribonuclease-4